MAVLSPTVCSDVSLLGCFLLLFFIKWYRNTRICNWPKIPLLKANSEVDSPTSSDCENQLTHICPESQLGMEENWSEERS